MALSVLAKQWLRTAVGNNDYGNEIIAAIESQGSGPAAKVASIGGTTNLPAAVVAPVTMTGAATAGGATPSATNVNTAIDAATAQIKGFLDVKADNVDIETLRVAVEARLDVVEAKVDAIISALTLAGLMTA
jgi:hypothetical protein